MSLYKRELPGCFPICIQVEELHALLIVNFLLPHSNVTPNGSSFAVTSDAPQGFRNVWLSETSAKCMLGAIIFDDLHHELHKQLAELNRPA